MTDAKQPPAIDIEEAKDVVLVSVDKVKVKGMVVQKESRATVGTSSEVGIVTHTSPAVKKTTFRTEHVSGGESKTALPMTPLRQHKVSEAVTVTPKQVSEALIQTLVEGGEDKRKRRDAMPPGEIPKDAISFVPVSIRKGGGRGR